MHANRSRRLVFKVIVSDPAQPGDPAEYTRHRAAYAEAPEEFRRHLTVPEDVPIRVGDGQWITFQSIAGDATELTVLLNSMLRVRGQMPVVACGSRTFAEACSVVVAGVLHEWNGLPQVMRTRQTVNEFLRHHVHGQLEAIDASATPVTTILTRTPRTLTPLRMSVPSPNTTMKPEPRPSLLQRNPDATDSVIVWAYAIFSRTHCH